MKLLYVCEAVSGGIAEYAIRQSNALVEAGVEVAFLCREGFRVEAVPNVQICKKLPCMPSGGGWPTLLARVKDERTVARVVACFVRSCGFKVVLFACYHEYLAPFWAMKLRRLAREGVVIGTIAHDPVRDFVLGPLWWHRLSVRLAYSFVSDIFVHGSTPVDTGGAKLKGKSIHNIPHGPYEVPSPCSGRESLRSRWNFTESDKVFLSFGQIRDGKNLDLFLRSMVYAPEEVKILVAGAGGGRSQRPPSFYRELAEELGLARRCRWDVRHIPNEEVGELFAVSDVVLLTYRANFHSASGVLNTAVACRKPVLASSGFGPLSEAVENYQLGVLIRPDDVQAIGEGILRILATSSAPQWDRYEQENSWKENAKRVIDALRLEMLMSTSTGVGGDRPSK